ncbi:MAG: hypothetical protein M0Q42_12875 [Xanthomonadales bacterium]|nr:hypothetical protein [Xanthomonadales bacterium]
MTSTTLQTPLSNRLAISVLRRFPLYLCWLLLLPTMAVAGDLCNGLPVAVVGDAGIQGSGQYLEVCSGGDQSTLINTEFEQPLRLRVMNVDSRGGYFIGLRPEPSAAGASALVYDPFAEDWVETAIAITDEDGFVQFRMRANGVPGSYGVEACLQNKGCTDITVSTTLTNVTAGQPPLPPSQPVPAMGMAGMAGLSILFLLLARHWLSRRRLMP